MTILCVIENSISHLALRIPFSPPCYSTATPPPPRRIPNPRSPLEARARASLQSRSHKSSLVRSLSPPLAPISTIRPELHCSDKSYLKL